MPRPEPTQGFPIVDLACCVPRAQSASGRQAAPDNDVYWHTREACVAMARSNGFLTQEIVRAISHANCLNDDEIRERSSQFWPQVAHPLILAR